MRIDLVITELNIGGAERCLTELAIGLKLAGDDVRVFCFDRLPQAPKDLLVQRLSGAGIEVESADTETSVKFLSAHKRLSAWLKSSPPDVCQTFLFHANVLGTRAARRCGVPVRVGGVRVAEARPIRCLVERLAVQQMHRVVCVSEGVRDFASKRLGCPPHKSVVIPNGVSIDRFRNAAPFDWTTIGWPADAVVSLFVGRLHPQKGIGLLQQEIETLAPAGSNRRLVIVGDGPLDGKVRGWADRVGQDRVKVLGWRDDVPSLMGGCRMLVLPSRYEGMANVALEAMAAGRSVVVSRVEGTEELFPAGTIRQTFTPGDAAEMGRLAESFLSDAEKSQHAGLANQSHVLNRFSIDAMVTAHRNLYLRLLSRRLES